MTIKSEESLSDQMKICYEKSIYVNDMVYYEVIKNGEILAWGNMK